MTEELSAVIATAKKAGEIVASYFKQNLTVAYKQDKFDPVTQADRESDAYIRQALGELFPNDDILSEENDARPKNYKNRVWMVDPLDGTKDFVAGRASFAVMIGLLDKNIPQLGVVYNPITKELFYAMKGKGCQYEIGGKVVTLYVNNTSNLQEAILVTRNQVAGDIRPLDEQVNALPIKSTLPEGSIGLKIGRIAQGKADVFVHTNIHGCKWDTLAAQVIIQEAGGVITDLEGNALDYTNDAVEWKKYFVAASDKQLLEQVLAKVKLPD